ncbi:MAG TPA: outer membrane protein transport protein [Polyangiales bacterium]|nr:outer membrane protein transport protein [Polyangiales bacterium]
MDPTRRARISSRIFACTLATAVFLPVQAHAGGFTTATFGGEHSTAADVTPSALYYNPGAIGFLHGQQLMLDAALAIHSASYTRDASVIDPSTLASVEAAGLNRQDAIDALSGEGSLMNVLLLPFVGGVTDLGMRNGPLRLGAAFFVPFGGQSSFDMEPDDPNFPGAADGPARWYNMEGTIRSLAATLALAYRFERARLSLGVAGTLYLSEVNSVRARNANATDNLVSADGSLLEGRSLLDVSGTHFGIGGGLLWEAIERVLWLGASYQSQPGLGTMQLTGTLSNTLGSAPPAAPDDVVFTQELPDIVRFGARLRPQRALELRVGVSWERWSRLEQMCLASDRVADVEAACETRSNGSLVDARYASDVVQVFARDWKDSIVVRGGASYYLGSKLELFGGVMYSSNAIPDRTLDPSLYDMDQLSFALGAAYLFGEHVSLTLTLTELLYFDRDTNGVPGNERLAAPSRQPANAGEYSQNTFLVQPSATFLF